MQGEISLIGKDVEIIEYPKQVDLWNFLTHLAGAGLSAAGIVLLLFKSQDILHTVSALIFGLSLSSVYVMSSVYHSLPSGEAKRKARLADHCIVPLLISGTATPCALIILFNLSTFHGLFVLTVSWSCTVFGIFSKLFFFNKLNIFTVCVYIVSGLVMLASVIPLLGQIEKGAFLNIILGCVSYLIGAVFCGFGVKYPWLHVVFHVFVLLGSTFHYFAVYTFMF